MSFAEKDCAAAFELIKPVIQFQDQVGKGEVELPAREMYADMLLELNRPAEALEQYRLSLKSDPNVAEEVASGAIKRLTFPERTHKWLKY
jgi:hypothetical protein